MHNLSSTEIKVRFLTCGNLPCGGFAGTKYLQTMVEECDIDFRGAGRRRTNLAVGCGFPWAVSRAESRSVGDRLPLSPSPLPGPVPFWAPLRAHSSWKPPSKAILWVACLSLPGGCEILKTLYSPALSYSISVRIYLVVEDMWNS